MNATVPLVFVVDDDPSVGRALTRLLRSGGYGALAFDSGEALLTNSCGGDCACLIIDVCMPAIGGFELQKMLPAHGFNVPVIIITAHDGPDVEQQAQDAGAIAFLRKPFDDRELLDAVSLALGGKTSERRNGK
jgi:FixJ family two-component response regulator